MKTLKDIQFAAEYYKNYKKYKEGQIANVDDLRDAAQEWIKESDTIRFEKLGFVDTYCDYPHMQVTSIKKFIEHFFNLEDKK